MGQRFGLLGTGHWARETQGAALAAHPEAELVGVWGRDPAKAANLAAHLGTRPYEDVDALIADVDAVAIALPPDVQGDLALRAARAGRHLLLDKPVALDLDVADALVAEAGVRGLASVVFFTHRFSDNVDTFLRTAADEGGWDGARATLFASIFRSDNPYGASPWRREKGGLWDVGPHLLSLVLPVLGPVEEVTALNGPRDSVHVLTRHRDGAVGSFSVTLDAAPEATTFSIDLYGEPGTRAVPGGDRGAAVAFGSAIDRLLDQVAGTPGDPCDLRFGREVVAVLTAAEESVRSGRTTRVTEAAGSDPAASR
ncbi:Gfo/Idh/MocA family protein [Nocardiopsis sp. MG754419]|uniref:Gfo/Idh/MocA family protein n=1 Tax=Nocardiopsis sp. MG754419 TaxID=2259865 RepID=UPI001BACCF1C|nr:Gfo/Idh/MocA family oxidoreductase [Nocardiopsis sp. MG754419]MBR8743652.1 gfo/Idh/MocA family oxidoreductase [Nocardiopsis sp. MG754419]